LLRVQEENKKKTNLRDGKREASPMGGTLLLLTKVSFLVNSGQGKSGKSWKKENSEMERSEKVSWIESRGKARREIGCESEERQI